jgi:hypothetical protein
VAPGTSQWRQVTAAANRLWQLLKGHVDSNGDKVVTKQEWVSTHEDSDFVDNVAIPLDQAAFELGDLDGDGRVSLSQWMTFQTVAGIGQREALSLFQALDTDGDGYLTSAEYAETLRAFYGSTDPDSVGNRRPTATPGDHAAGVASGGAPLPPATSPAAHAWMTEHADAGIEAQTSNPQTS